MISTVALLLSVGGWLGGVSGGVGDGVEGGSVVGDGGRCGECRVEFVSVGAKGTLLVMLGAAAAAIAPKEVGFWG